MTATIYFAGAPDTAIAEPDGAFIRELQNAAGRMQAVKAVDKPELADLILIDEQYRFRTWRYAGELAQCAFVKRHADRILVINHDDHARTFLHGLYVSLENSRPPPVHTAAVPYKRDLWRIPLDYASDYRPKHLYAFRGTYHTHPVRKRIAAVLFDSKDGIYHELRKAFHDHDDHDQKHYIDEIRNAHFSICPRGVSPATYRVYESMQIGRCPVIVSDDWRPPSGPDWKSFSVSVPESQVKTLPRILAEHADKAECYGRAAREAWEAYFSWPRRYEYFLEQALSVHTAAPDREGFEHLQQIWTSSSFKRRHGWTLPRRAKQFLIRKYKTLVEPSPPV